MISIDPLLDPIPIGSLALQNRVVMAPLTRARATNAAMVPTSLHAIYYGQRAEAGLIVSEGLWISPASVGAAGVPGIFNSEQASAWAHVTEKVHATQGRMVAQLGHTGSLSHPDFHGGRLPLAPSAVNPRGEVSTISGRKATVTPRAMTLGDIQDTISDYANATRMAMRAGFDGVEVSAHQAYLLQSFLNPALNLRTDDYGGDLANRTRLLLEVITAVRAALLPGTVLGVKIGPYRADGAGYDASPETDEEYRTIASWLDSAGVDFLHLMAPRSGPRDPFETDASVRSVRQFRPLFSRTIIANGGHDATTARAIIQEGHADAVSFGRPFIANPDLVERLTKGTPLAEADPETIYKGGPNGYIDYPRADDPAAISRNEPIEVTGR